MGCAVVSGWNEGENRGACHALLRSRGEEQRRLGREKGGQRRRPGDFPWGAREWRLERKSEGVIRWRIDSA